MNTVRSRALRSHAFGSLLIASLIALLLCTGAGNAHARDHSAGAQDRAQEAASAADAAAGDEDGAADHEDKHALGDWDEYFKWTPDWDGHLHRHHHGDTLVNFGADSKLPAGAQADSVVSIFGSSSSAGDADDVVSVIGSTRVSGRVRDSAVAIFGSTYVDGVVGGDVVAVFGNVELGPNADVGGDVAAVGGRVIRDPAATVHGEVQSVGGFMSGFSSLRPWIDHCLLYGRPLALVPGIGWAWTLAFSLLALYLGIALLFRGGISRCVSTVESHPGTTLVAALLAMLLTPILIVLLCITVVGIAAIPFVVFGLFCAALFGKAVMLAVVGRRVIGTGRVGAADHPALAVLIGGLIVLVLYLVPVLGFVVYKLLGVFGFGAVVYTIILASRARREAQQPSAGTTYASAAARSPAAAAGGAPGASGAGVAIGAAAPTGSAGPAEGVFAASGAGAGAAAPGAAPGAASGAVPGAAPGPAPGPAPGAAPGPAFGPAPGAAPGPASASSAPGVPPAATITAALPRAGFWIRMAALLLDALLVGVVTSILHHDLELVVLAVYGAVMWKLRGSTIGGIVFDLHVVRVDGRAIDWETAIVRALGCFLSLAVAGLGFLWIAFDGAKQAWHDKIAGTVVVRVPKGVPLV